MDFAGVVESGILAEIYIVEHLRNQASDLLQSQLISGACKLTTAIVKRVYETVPAGCILRQPCTIALGSTFTKQRSGSRNNEDEIAWKVPFEQHVVLGWDFSQHYHGQRDLADTFSLFNSYRFHVHEHVEVNAKGFEDCPAAHSSGLKA